MVTDEGGNILEEIEFNAYGEITGGGANVPRTSISEVNSNNLSGLENLFVGAYGIKYDGKTNLHYMRYRWYSADQMRFLSPDLLLGINRYAYCHNNPVNFTDILGLKATENLIVLYYEDIIINDSSNSSQPLITTQPVIAPEKIDDYKRKGIICERFTIGSLRYALLHGKTVLIATHGYTDYKDPIKYINPLVKYRFDGIVGYNAQGDDFKVEMEILCAMIRRLKAQKRLETKYLFIGACASGNLPKPCKDVGSHLTYIGNKMPINPTTYTNFVEDFAQKASQGNINITQYLAKQKIIGRHINDKRTVFYQYYQYNYFMVFSNNDVYAVNPVNNANPSLIQSVPNYFK